MRNIERLPPLPGPAIAHSPFAGADCLLNLRAAHPAVFRLESGRTVEPAEIHPLMLGYALSLKDIGVVLCSMLDDRHLRANIDVVERPAFGAADIEAFVASIRATAL